MFHFEEEMNLDIQQVQTCSFQTPTTLQALQLTSE